MTPEFKLKSFELAPIVAKLLERINQFDNTKASKKNLVDPFAAALEFAVNEYPSQVAWEFAEQGRQRQKNLMNHIGDLQQSIIGQLEGWESHSSGTHNPDIVGSRGRQKMIAEVKNKHNTMNHNSSGETYDVLDSFLDHSEFHGFTAAVITVIAPPAKDVFFRHFAPGGRPIRNDIVLLSGRVFYAIATDPMERTPFIDFQPNEDMRKWPSWIAIDLMLEEFWAEIQSQTGQVVPKWIRNLTEQALG
jgi:hypothetical protein